MLLPSSRHKSRGTSFTGYIRTEIIESTELSVPAVLQLEPYYHDKIFNELIFEGETTTEVINRLLQRGCSKYFDELIDDVPNTEALPGVKVSVEVYGTIYREIEQYAKDPRWCRQYYNSDLQQLRSGRTFNLAKAARDLLVYVVDYLPPALEIRSIDQVKFKLKCFQALMTENPEEKILLRHVMYFLRREMSSKKIKESLLILHDEYFLRLSKSIGERQTVIGNSSYTHIKFC